ncbi:MAG: rhomboid family intramembrane serine protease [Prevotellaceae bacterium]|jgi:membrane associated rhomboid family serine protease|nr:rhomboid family intramembrane serine protease [Prevotellaceae bacterium]
MNKYLLATIAIVASFLCSFIPPAIYPMPTVGASGMIYVLMGLYFGVNRKSALSKPMIIFIATIMILLSVSFFKPNSNFYLHLFCLASGFAISGSRSYLQKHIHRRAD